MIFENLKNKFQLRFKNRIFAANILAGAIQDLLGKEKISKDKLAVLGIPRGGIVVADIVASKLKCQLNIVIPRKLTAPHNKEIAIGAISEDGTTYLNEEIVKSLEVKDDYIEQEKQRQMDEISQRKSLYQDTDKNISKDIETVILIDDGAASGSTLIAAARWLRKKYPVKKLIIALPVAPKDTVEILKKESDQVVVVTTPSKTFNSVGQYYQDFAQVSDDHVIEICKRRGILVD